MALVHRSGARLTAASPELARAAGLEAARRLVAAYEPHDAAQAHERERVLAFVDEHADALLRTCVPGHLTASVLLVDAAGERALLTHHRKLGRWLQLGGHADGDGDLVRVALREATEESGIDGLAIDPVPIDIDVHTIPERRRSDGVVEPAHLHLDVRFVVHAPHAARESVSEESHAIAWFAPDQLAALDVDDSVARLFRLGFGSDGCPSR